MQYRYAAMFHRTNVLPNKVDVFPAKQLASCREASIFYSDHLESDAFLCRT